jgi:hypothetical protein
MVDNYLHLYDRFSAGSGPRAGFAAGKTMVTGTAPRQGSAIERR